MKTTNLPCFLAVALLGAVVLAKAQTTTPYTFVHDGVTRNYLLRVPAGFTPGESIPLVLNLHGRGSNAFQQALYTKLDAVADRERFAVCYPDGLNNEWNVGWSFGSRADDLGFLSRLVDTLQARYGFDESRTYSCGMSNGGFMSYVLACERPAQFAAVGSVTGGMVPGQRNRCTPALPVPVMQIHGTADATVAYAGSAINDAIDTTAAFWARRNGCDPTPREEAIPDRRDDGFTSARRTWDGCDGAAEVQLITVRGGGHTWPDAVIDLGATTYDFSASEELWAFFRRFRRAGTSAVGAGALRQNLPQGRLGIAPNPWRGGPLSLKPAERSRDLKLYSSLGQPLQSFTLPAGASYVYPEGLSPGTYFVVETGRSGGGIDRLVVVD